MEKTTYNFKEVMSKPERLAPGHRMCAGCGGTITVRTVLRALEEGDRAVIGNATGCLEVSSFMYPYTAYEDSYIHNAFENAGATLSGVETAYHVLRKRERSGITSSSSLSEETAVHTTSDSSPYRARWSADMTWYMSVMTTVPT